MLAHPLVNDGMDKRRTPFIPIPEQIKRNNYENNLIKSIERERRLLAVQQKVQREQVLTQPLTASNSSSPKSPYLPISVQGTSQVPQRVLPTPPIVFPTHRSPIKPLRIVIIRHAERADAVLGSDWSKKSFDRSGQYIRSSEHLPDALPTRSYLHHYVIDVPLTNRGRMHAFMTGKTLLANGYAIDTCYTSPSLRCVQSADGILAGMGRKEVPLKLETGLFECYLNDFKRTLCFMTKDEVASNGYRIDRSYKPLMSFLRPQDSQADYYERCRIIMDVITERHQANGGTILIVAHAPSLEGLTRHLSGGKFQPEKLFEIARRVPFLAMTIIEKKSLESPWFFRAEPLQINRTQSSREVASEEVSPTTIDPYGVPKRSRPPNSNAQARLVNRSALIDPKKIAKSATEPNLPDSHAVSRMFRVV